MSPVFLVAMCGSLIALLIANILLIFKLQIIRRGVYEGIESSQALITEIKQLHANLLVDFDKAKLMVQETSNDHIGQ